MLVGVVIASVVLASCGVFQDSGGGQQGGENGGGGGGGNTLNFNLQADIPDLNSTTTTDSVSFDVLNNVMEGLYRIDNNEQPQPAMAEDVQISDDELTYTFTLRDGIQWSNGDPVTSQDFKYAWLRAMDPDTAGQYSFIITEYIEGATEFNAGEGGEDDVAIETPDDQTLEVTLTRPTPYFVGLTAFITYLPQNQEFTEEQGDDYAQSADALLYNGPYTMSEFNPARGVTLDKNADYWDEGEVNINKVNARVVKEEDTAVNLYESGELDVTEIGSDFVDQFQDDEAFDQITLFATFYLTFNQEDETFQNENIRKAFQIGYDREALANQILNDGSIGAEGYVPPGMDAGGEGDDTFRDVAPNILGDVDADEARQLYEQGVEELGEEPTIELLSDDTTTARDGATFLQSQFEENLGIQVEINTQPFDQRLQLEEDGDFQMSVGGWIGDYNDPMTFLDLWTSDSAFNNAAFENEEYDQIIADAKEESDFAARQEMLIEAEGLLIEDQAVIGPMYHLGESRLIRPSVQDLHFHPYGSGVDFKGASLE